VSSLSDPNTDVCSQAEAALYKQNREEYDRQAREWTSKYAKANDDLAEIQQNTNEVCSLN
jgi:hypothetical protein